MAGRCGRFSPSRTTRCMGASPMLAEIRLLARTARELWRSRTAAAVIVIAGDDNLVETFELDGTDTAAVLLTAVRGLKRWPDPIEFQRDVDPFPDPAPHLSAAPP